MKGPWLRRALRLVAPVACATALACAPRAPVLLTPEEFRREVGRLGLDPARVVNPLEADDAMARAAERFGGVGGEREQLRALQGALFDGERFTFDYDSRQSLTAREAFRERRGNCVSFTNLFIALARARGIEVGAALADRGSTSEREGDLVVVNTHVVAAHLQAGDLALFDFFRRSGGALRGVRVIDDLWVAALYHNNLGAERLHDGDLGRAAWYFETASRLAPSFVAPLANLGIVLRRQGNVDGAFDAYRRALAVAPTDPAVLGNLAALYASLGREREARAALAAADVRVATPWALLLRGDVELADGRPDAALRFYRRARKLLPDSAAPLVAMARAEAAAGRKGAARRAADRALILDPGNAEAEALRSQLSR